MQDLLAQIYGVIAEAKAMAPHVGDFERYCANKPKLDAELTELESQRDDHFKLVAAHAYEIEELKLQRKRIEEENATAIGEVRRRQDQLVKLELEIRKRTRK